ncbi:MAG: hypothetical protein N2595_01450 [bacterium]|nr:hypothetical protein [bacterium]
MKNNIVSLFALAGITAHAAFAAWNVLENGALRIEISGDGVIGSLVYKPYHTVLKHVNDYSVRVRYANELQETVEYTSSENNYPAMRLFTGYGRDYRSNMYVYSATYMDPSSSYLDQTLVCIPRFANVQASFGQFINPEVLQTATNDIGEFSFGNKLLLFREGNENCWIGTVSRSVLNQETFKYVIGPPTYVLDTLGTMVSGIVSNDLLDAGGAAWWDVVTLGQSPYVIYNRLLAAPNKSTAESLANIPDETGRRVKVPTQITPLKLKFSQVFTKPNKDFLVLKAQVNLAPYATIFTTLNDLDISIYLGDFFSLQTSDAGSAVIGGKGRKLANKKADPATGVHVLTMKYKKYVLRFTLKIAKSNLSSATGLYATSPEARNADLQIPFCMVLTGTNPNDTKGGMCFIIARGFAVKYSKPSQKKAWGAYLP